MINITINAINPYYEPYTISFDDNLLRIPLDEFIKTLPDSVVIIDIK